MKVRPTGLVLFLAFVELLASPPASGGLMAQGISLGLLVGGSSARMNAGDGDWPGDETWQVVAVAS